MKQSLEELIDLIEDEQHRVKIWLNNNRFHHGTAPFIIAKQYRDELKKYLRILYDDKNDTETLSYQEIEKL